MKRIGLVSFAVITTLIAACSTDHGKGAGQATHAEPSTVGTSGAADIVGRDAEDFIHHFALVNIAEMNLGELAADRGGADEVKRFAHMMIDDHTAAGDKLKVLASDLKIEAPDQIDDKHMDQRNNLAKRSGADFDREYASAMVDGHKDLLDQLEPRIDKKTLDQWKVARNGKTTVAGPAAAIPADPSDNPTTMRVNQFAADLYPTVHAHLEAAKALQSSLQKR